MTNDTPTAPNDVRPPVRAELDAQQRTDADVAEPRVRTAWSAAWHTCAASHSSPTGGPLAADVAAAGPSTSSSGG